MGSDTGSEPARTAPGPASTPLDVRAPGPPGTSAGDQREDPTLLPAPDVARAMDVAPDTGLTDAEAAARLAAYGPNELRGRPPVPAWRRFLRQFQDPLVYLLVVAVVISSGVWVLEGATGVPIDAVVIAAILLLNAVMGYAQEHKAADAVAALRSMTAARSTVLRQGRRLSVPSDALVPGDILLLAEGDAVGADARLLSAAALQVQESSLTGESTAVTKDAAPLATPASLGDRTNMVFKGTAVATGVGVAVVVATGMRTEMGAIADLLDTTEQESSPLTEEITQVSKVLGIVVISIAAVVMTALVLLNDVRTGTAFVDVLLLGVSLAVAAVPEGLPAILSVVLAIGVQQMAEQRAVVKELHAVETLGSASVICSDKTGTLTRNEMTIRKIVTASGTAELTGTGYAPVGEVCVQAQPLVDGPQLREVRALLVQGSLANNAQLSQVDGEWTVQGDPTEAAFLVAVRKLEGALDRAGRYRRIGEVPFSSDRRMMSTLQTRPGRTRLMTKGAPDVLLEHCDHYRLGDQVRPLDPDLRVRVLAEVEELSAQGYRTLGVAYRDVPDEEEIDPGRLGQAVEHHLVYVGMVAIIDPPRDEARDAIAEAHRAGIRTIMITGDHPRTAARIGQDLGIIGPGGDALTGARLDGLSEEEFAQVAREVSVYARVAPHHKLRIVNALQADGRIVAMTGDGVNDAPALKRADIGIAMGITGTEVTKDAARMVLADDNYATIVQAVRQGRVIFANIKKFLRYLLSSNMGEVFTVFLGVVLAGVIGLQAPAPGGLALPLLATQILWINLVTDSGPALAMGVDPQIDDVMADPPRDPAERIIDREMWRGILLLGAVMGVSTLLTIDMFLPGGMLPGSHSYREAQTAGFTTLVLAQVFNALNSRSETTSVFRHLFVNPWLWAAIATVVVLQILVVEVPLLQAAFSTAPLSPVQWLVCVAMGSVVLWFDELRKVALRARRQHRSVGSVRPR